MHFKSLESIALAITAGSILLFSSAAALAGDPVPGVNVASGKNPGPAIAIIATTDKAGRFMARFAEPGSYTISFLCSEKSACPRFATAAAADGKPLTASREMTYDLIVGRDHPVILTGTVESATDSGEAATVSPACPSVVAVGAPGQSRTFVNTTRSNIKHGSAAEAKRPSGVAVGEPGQSRQLINTSRSNIKHGLAAEATQSSGAAVEPMGQTRTAINTCRSNIKHGLAADGASAAASPGAPRGTCDAASAQDDPANR
jgi:hypothetical protein